MKLFLFALFAACLTASGVGFGDSKADVLNEHGEPLSRNYKANGHEIWQYPRGQITMRNGTVIQAIMASTDKPFAPKLPPAVLESDKPKVAILPATPMAPKGEIAPKAEVNKNRDGEAQKQQGIKLANDLRSSVDFLVASPERQRDILQSFQVRYPMVDIRDLTRSVAGVLQRRAQVKKRAAQVPPPNNQPANARQLIEAAEQAAALAEAKVETERARLAEEVARRRQIEAERERDARNRSYNPYSYAPNYSSGVVYTPSYKFTPYTPTYTFQNSSYCAPVYRSPGYTLSGSYNGGSWNAAGRVTGFTPYRTTTRSSSYRAGLGSLAFGNLTR